MFKLLFALLIISTVGIKFAAFGAIPRTNDIVEQRLETFFRQSGYSVEASEKDADPFYLSLVSGSCSMRVYLASPEGWHRFIIRQLRLPQENTFFLFDGVKYADQPIWTTWFSYQSWRLSKLFGKSLPFKPVLGINLSPMCDDASLPWSEIARLPI
jgi:hypothetical protein